MKEKTDAKTSRKLLLIGIIGCLLYVIGDFLLAATGRTPSFCATGCSP